MIEILEFDVSRAEKFPSIDMAYDQGKSYNPISELMRAIILRAIEDLKCEGELRDDALSFFYDDDNNNDDDAEDDHVFSFSSICQYLGLDPQATRACITKARSTGRRISTRRRAA